MRTNSPTNQNNNVVDKYIELLSNQHEILLENQNDIGKWILATLVLINGGAIVGMMSAKDVSYDAIDYSAPFFGLGLSSALVTGIMTWWNVMELAKIRKKELTMVLETKIIPSPPIEDPELNWKSGLSVIFGGISIALFVLGSALAWWNLSRRPIPSPSSALINVQYNQYKAAVEIPPGGH